MGAGFARPLLGRNGSEFEAPEGDAARFQRRLRDDAQVPRALARGGLHPRHRASFRSHAGAGIVPVKPLDSFVYLLATGVSSGPEESRNRSSPNSCLKFPLSG